MMRVRAILGCVLVLTVSLAAGSTEAGVPSDSTSSARFVLRRGRVIDVRFRESLRPRGISNGQRVELEVADDVLVDGRVVVREGAKVIGHVEEVKRAQAVGVPARLDIVIDLAQAVSGEVVPLSGLYSTKGTDRSIEAAGIAIFWCVLGLLVPGENVLIAEGTIVTCFVRKNVSIHMEEPDAETHRCGADSGATDSAGHDPDSVRSE